MTDKNLIWCALIYFVIVLILLCIFVYRANALSLKPIVSFGTGICTSVAIHKAGHILVAKNENINLKFKNGRVNVSDKEDTTLFWMSGLGMQVLSSEAILLNNTQNYYTHGILFWNIAREITYPLFQYNKAGDFGSLECSNNKKAWLAIGFVCHGLFTMLRVMNRNSNIKSQLIIGKNNIGVKLGRRF